MQGPYLFHLLLSYWCSINIDNNKQCPICTLWLHMLLILLDLQGGLSSCVQDIIECNTVWLLIYTCIACTFSYIYIYHHHFIYKPVFVYWFYKVSGRIGLLKSSYLGPKE